VRNFPKNDFADARKLVSDLGISSREELRGILDTYIPRFLITARVEEFMTALMEEE